MGTGTDTGVGRDRGAAHQQQRSRRAGPPHWWAAHAGAPPPLSRGPPCHGSSDAGSPATERRSPRPAPAPPPRQGRSPRLTWLGCLRWTCRSRERPRCWSGAACEPRAGAAEAPLGGGRGQRSGAEVVGRHEGRAHDGRTEEEEERGGSWPSVTCMSSQWSRLRVEKREDDRTHRRVRSPMT
jgi:hypothetical protein